MFTFAPSMSGTLQTAECRQSVVIESAFKCCLSIPPPQLSNSFSCRTNPNEWILVVYIKMKCLGVFFFYFLCTSLHSLENVEWSSAWIGVFPFGAATSFVAQTAAIEQCHTKHSPNVSATFQNKIIAYTHMLFQLKLNENEVYLC